MTERRLRLVGTDTDLPYSQHPGSGEVQVYVEHGRVVILLSGDVDLTITEDLEQAGRSAIDAGLPLMVDVRHVGLIDSIGVSFLVRLAASAHNAGHGFVACGPAPVVAEMLQIAGASHLIEWVEGRPGPDGEPTP